KIHSGCASSAYQLGRNKRNWVVISLNRRSEAGEDLRSHHGTKHCPGNHREKLAIEPIFFIFVSIRGFAKNEGHHDDDSCNEIWLRRPTRSYTFEASHVAFSDARLGSRFMAGRLHHSRAP